MHTANIWFAMKRFKTGRAFVFRYAVKLQFSVLFYPLSTPPLSSPPALSTPTAVPVFSIRDVSIL